MPRIQDLVGKRYGMLLVIEFDGLRKSKRWWKCLCDCGNTRVFSSGSLSEKGDSAHCGCKYSENLSKAMMGHEVSDAHKAKLSKLKKGVPLTKECKEKISMAKSGTKLTKEHRENIRKSQFKFWGERNPDDIVRLHDEGKSTLEIEKETGYSFSYVARYLRNIGVEFDPPEIRNREHFFDQDFFCEINTEAKAYWLGFITADGCVSKDRGCLSIGLGIVDFSHLEKFASDIKYDGKVSIVNNARYGKNHKSARLALFSGKLINDLEFLGVTERKSFTAEVAPYISEDLLRHYWRGVIDGDGCIYQNENKQSQISISFTGSKHMAEAFQSWCKSRANTQAKTHPHAVSEGIWEYYVGGRNKVSILLKELYNNCSIYLDRKYEKAMEIIGK